MIMTIITYLSKVFLASPFYFTIIFLGLSFFICVFIKGWPILPKSISSFLSSYIDEDDDEDDDEGDDEDDDKNVSYNVSIKNFRFKIEDKTYEISTDLEINVKRNG